MQMQYKNSLKIIGINKPYNAIIKKKTLLSYPCIQIKEQSQGVIHIILIP
jgi:hypothetical protein